MKDIKNIKPNKKSGYIQGYYTPINPTKYKGQYPIIYRSSIEKKFMIQCDTDPRIIEWMSETFSINYYNILDKKWHAYWPDFLVKIKGSNGFPVTYVVEAKSDKQLVKPVRPKNNNTKALAKYVEAYKTYVTNVCKIETLKKFAQSHGMKVLLYTENSKTI